jgi:hypothetical protein
VSFVDAARALKIGTLVVVFEITTVLVVPSQPIEKTSVLEPPVISQPLITYVATEGEFESTGVLETVFIIRLLK